MLGGGGGALNLDTSSAIGGGGALAGGCALGGGALGGGALGGCGAISPGLNLDTPVGRAFASTGAAIGIGGIGRAWALKEGWLADDEGRPDITTSGGWLADDEERPDIPTSGGWLADVEERPDIPTSGMSSSAASSAMASSSMSPALSIWSACCQDSAQHFTLRQSAAWKLIRSAYLAKLSMTTFTYFLGSIPTRFTSSNNACPLL